MAHVRVVIGRRHQGVCRDLTSLHGFSAQEKFPFKGVHEDVHARLGVGARGVWKVGRRMGDGDASGIGKGGGHSVAVVLQRSQVVGNQTENAMRLLG